MPYNPKPMDGYMLHRVQVKEKSYPGNEPDMTQSMSIKKSQDKYRIEIINTDPMFAD